MSQEELFNQASALFYTMPHKIKVLVLLEFSVNTCEYRGKSVLDVWIDAVNKIDRLR
jgi:hypothetical protein